MIKAASARKRARKYFAPQNEGVHRKCDHPGCNKDGEFKAPKDRSLKDYYWFCLEHVQEYNSRWNYYTDDDSEPEHEAFRKKTRFSGFHSKIKYKFGCDLDEELEFLTGTADIESALPQLLVGDVQLVLYTCGSSGAHAYTRTAHGFAPCRKVRAVDTTGAGDGFIGSFLWQLERDGVTRNKLEKLSRARLCEYLAFSNQFCGISVQQHGAIDSYPTLDQMQ